MVVLEFLAVTAVFSVVGGFALGIPAWVGWSRDATARAQRQAAHQRAFHEPFELTTDIHTPRATPDGGRNPLKSGTVFQLFPDSNGAAVFATGNRYVPLNPAEVRAVVRAAAPLRNAG